MGYMYLVNKHIKESFHNKTVGIIITKEPNKKNGFIVDFVSEKDIIPLTYLLEEKAKHNCK